MISGKANRARRNVLVSALTQDAPDAARHAVDLRLQGVGDVGPDRGKLLAPVRIVPQVELGPQPSHGVMERFQMIADIAKLAAADFLSQIIREAKHIVQRQADRDAVGR